MGAFDQNSANAVMVPVLDSYIFEIGWASQEEINKMLPLLEARKRQTMNLRSYASPKLLKCTYLDSIIGWAGLDVDQNSEYPEVFSLFIEPQFRRYTIGMVMELARYTYFAERGIKYVYGRMEAASNFALMRHRIKTGVWHPMNRDELDPEWVKGCQSCNLFGKECTEQVYMRVDVDKARAAAEARLGAIDISSLPRQFEIRTVELQERPRTLQRPGLGTPARRGQGYRPVWI